VLPSSGENVLLSSIRCSGLILIKGQPKRNKIDHGRSSVHFVFAFASTGCIVSLFSPHMAVNFVVSLCCLLSAHLYTSSYHLTQVT
jgi:hypothetical protein